MLSVMVARDVPARPDQEVLQKLHGEVERVHALYTTVVAENGRLRQQIAWLVRQLFGQKRERLDAEALRAAWEEYQQSFGNVRESETPTSLPLQLLLALIPEANNQETSPPSEEPAPSPPPPPPDPKPKGKGRDPHGRSPIPEHAPTERIVFEPDVIPDGARCIGEEISERWAFRAASYVRLLVVRPKYAVDEPHGATSVTVADVPHEMIPRGMCDPAMLAHMIQSKWGDHLPWERIEGILARQGVSISASTLAGWAQRAEPLARMVVDSMRDHARAHAITIAIDATTANVKAKEKCKRGYPWVMVADQDHVLFGFSGRHVQDVPKELLQGYRGYVLADASSVYDALFEAADGPTEAGCWSHCRRRFFFAAPTDTRAIVGLKLADTLFAIERELADLSPSLRRADRIRRSKPVLDEFAHWRDGLMGDATVDPRGPLAKALRYSMNHWNALCRFLENGRIPISNNVSERQLRHIAVGRKNWMFFGSEEHAKIACTWLSLIASAKLNGLNPEAYLRDLFRVLPGWPESRVFELAPKNWSQTRARLNAQELEAPLGGITIPPKVSETQQLPEQSDTS
jgi:transposase